MLLDVEMEEEKHGARPSSPIDGYGVMAAELREEVVSMELQPPQRSIFTREDVVATSLALLASLGVGYLLVALRALFMPLAVSLFLLYLLNPLVDWLTRPNLRWLRRCRRRLNAAWGLPTRRRHRNSAESAAAAAAAAVGARDAEEAAAIAADSSASAAELAAALHESFSTPEAGLLDRPAGLASRPRSPLLVNSDGVPVRLQPPGWQRHCRLWPPPRWLAVLLTMTLLVAAAGGTLFLVISSVQNFVQEEFLLFQDAFNGDLAALDAWLTATFDVNVSSLTKQLQDVINLPDLISSVALTAVDAVGSSVMVILFTMYLLMEERVYPADSIMLRIDIQIRRYIGLKTFVSLLAGITVGITLSALGVSMPVLFGFLAFLFNFVPNIGAIISTFIPMPLVLLDASMTPLAKVLALVLPVVEHTLIGNFIEPNLFGGHLDLHPVIVLLCLAFWFALWGVTGAVLAVPLTAVLRLVLSYVDSPYAAFVVYVLDGMTESEADSDDDEGEPIDPLLEELDRASGAEDLELRSLRVKDD